MLRMLKTALKKWVANAVQRPLLWALMEKALVKPAGFALSQRRIALAPVNHIRGDQDALKRIAPAGKVLSGPFRGMAYPELRTIGSALIPKLLGSYERELHPLLESLLENNYTDVVDIGCAEGYYAVGLAMRMPQATVHAFDVNEEALQLCRQMAAANGVSDRLNVGRFCDGDTLLSIPYRGKALIISDCEGFEKTLFSEEVIAGLNGHDLLIETHDFIDIEISTVLRERLASTHEVSAISSVDDIAKALSYDYPELSPYDLESRRDLLAEHRPAIMQWLFATPATPEP